MDYGRTCYFVRCNEPEHRMFGKIKIGKTSSITRRLQGYKKEIGAVELLGLIQGYSDLEKELLKRFDVLRIGANQHRREGITEWCEPNAELLDFIHTQARNPYEVLLSPYVIEGLTRIGTTLGGINDILVRHIDSVVAPQPRIYADFEIELPERIEEAAA